MRRLPIIAALTLAIAPALALADGHAGGHHGHGGGHADVHVAIPAHHSMAFVRPGVRVVLGLDDEVFYTNDHYWLHRDDGWYHAMHHGDAFVYVDDGDVPAELIGLPVGPYHHHHNGAFYAGDGSYVGYRHHAGGGCGGY